MSFARPLLIAVTLLGLVLTARPLQAADDPNPEATRQYAVAYGFQSKKLFAQAMPRWTEFVKAFPQDTRVPNAQYQLGIACANSFFDWKP